MQDKVKDAAWMTPEIEKALQELEKLKGNEKLRALYEARKRDLQVQMTLMEERFNEGIEKGIEKGFARRLLSQGESLERAALLTELSVEELRALKSEQN